MYIFAACSVSYYNNYLLYWNSEKSLFEVFFQECEMIIPVLDLLLKPKYQCMKNVISFKWLYDKRGDLHIVFLKDTYMSIYFIFLTSSALWKKCNLGIFASKLGFLKILNVAAPKELPEKKTLLYESYFQFLEHHTTLWAEFKKNENWE